MKLRSFIGRAAILAPMLVLVIWGAVIIIYFPDAPLRLLDPDQAQPKATATASNRPPQVTLATERVETSELRVQLSGQAADDGLPDPPGRVLLSWQLMEGPSGARIENPQSEKALLRASVPGTYRIRLSASDGELLGYAEMLVVVAPPQAHFEDVPLDHPQFEAIQSLSDGGFLSGCSEDPPLFCPDEPLTRAQAAVFLLRGLYGADYKPESVGETGFQDVSPEDWFAPWVDQLRREGFARGCQSDPPLFCPERVITRAEGAVLFVRLLRGMPYDPPPAQGILSDLPAQDWRARWAEAALQEGLMDPCDRQLNAFCADDPLTRGQAALVLARALDLVPRASQEP